MWLTLRFLLGILIGGAIGAFIGWKGRCTTGACPLTSNPYLGAVWGAMLGALFTTAWMPLAAKQMGFKSPLLQEDTMSSTLLTSLETEQAFEEFISQASGPVLVDFWAPWCGPCRVQGRILEELAEAHSGQARIAKVNVDDLGGPAQQYGVSAIPTLIVFENGKALSRMVGVQSRQALEQALGLNGGGAAGASR